MSDISISGSAVYIDPTAFEPATEVLVNGMGSMFTIFMQFLPAIIIMTIAIVIVTFIIKMMKGGKTSKLGGVGNFKTSIKN